MFSKNSIFNVKKAAANSGFAQWLVLFKLHVDFLLENPILAERINSCSSHYANSRNFIANFMNDTLNDFKVTDRQTFIKFLNLLHKDFLDNPENWESKTLPDFLKALSAYTEDVQGYYDNLNQNVNSDKAEWSTVADIFKGAKIYE